MMAMFCFNVKLAYIVKVIIFIYDLDNNLNDHFDKKLSRRTSSGTAGELLMFLQHCLALFLLFYWPPLSKYDHCDDICDDICDGICDDHDYSNDNDCDA